MKDVEDHATRRSRNTIQKRIHMSWFDKFRAKKMCLICGKKIGDGSTEIKYRYEGGKMGVAHLCVDCSGDMETEEGDQFDLT